MVKEPATLVEPLKKAGASNITFHIESDMPEGGVPAMIKMVRDAGISVGIVIKPDTPVDTVFPYVSMGLWMPVCRCKHRSLLNLYYRIFYHRRTT